MFSANQKGRQGHCIQHHSNLLPLVPTCPLHALTVMNLIADSIASESNVMGDPPPPPPPPN